MALTEEYKNRLFQLILERKYNFEREIEYLVGKGMEPETAARLIRQELLDMQKKSACLKR